MKSPLAVQQDVDLVDALPHEGQVYVKQGVLAASVPTEITLPSRAYTKGIIERGGESLSGEEEP